MLKMKRKLNLEALKVESFVTSLENENSHTVKGGGLEAVFIGSFFYSVVLTVIIITNDKKKEKDALENSDKTDDSGKEKETEG